MESQTNKIIDCVNSEKEIHLNQLLELLKMPSVSADPARKNDLRKCGEWLVKFLQEKGFENASLKETGGHPAVYADWLHAENKPTILVYGHYDVQPEDPLNKWDTKPFEPVIKDGYIYARGASDDKGQFMVHLLALESTLKTTGKLPVNVKIFIEGEEEGGTGSTDKFVEKNAKLLACDAVAVSDTPWFNEDTPSIVYSLKGMCYLEVNLKGPKRDLHSGLFGGVVNNPLNAMAHIISKLQDEEGVINIPHIYDDVVPLTSDERKSFKEIETSENDIAKELGVDSLWGEKNYSSIERNFARPTLDIHGIWGGFQGEGSKTVIPSECGFKVSSRLVFNQNPERIFKLYENYIRKITPKGITINIKYHHGAVPLMVPRDNPYLKSAMRAMQKAFGKEPVLVRHGASVPITATFMRVLNAPPLFVGLGLEGDQIHSPNERFKLSHFYNGIIFGVHLYNELGKSGH